ncbi:hypothetical protein D3C84_1150730 [compost metagenome]
MNGLCSRLLCNAENKLPVQVTVFGGTFPDQHRFVGPVNMQTVLIRLRIHGH